MRGALVLLCRTSSPGRFFARPSSASRLALLARPAGLFSRPLHSSASLEMNVTKDNFASAVGDLKPLLATASFVAIDLEMTGIHIPCVFVERMDDTTEQRYAKMKVVAEHYKIIQAGLCLFHAEPSSDADSPRYTVRPYNFYLFPEGGQINMEAGAVAFNCSHQMDWNKWEDDKIYEGVPYVTTAEELALREKFYGSTPEGWAREEARVAKLNGHTVMDDSTSSPAAAPADGEALPVEKKQKKAITLERESDIAFVDGVKAQITGWLATRSEDQHELLLPECNSFLRLAIHQWMELVVAGDAVLAGADRANIFLETRPVAGQRWKSSFVACHYTATEREELAAAAAVKKRTEYERKLGFKSVWNELAEAGRPIVVHNGFFDLLFLWSHFESSPLPATLVEFKAALAARFPSGIFDTKFLSASRQFAFPYEHWAKKALETETNHSESTNARITQAKALNVPTTSHGQSRFRETHLEKLWLALKKEGETRAAAEANGGAASSPPAPAAPATGGPGLFNVTVANPPPPFGSVVMNLAPGFDKYALIGQPGGDPSAAHEAGYDAWMTAAIFAHFAAEAPAEELSAPLSLSADSSSLASPWRNRVPLFRHLLALDMNLSPETGLPKEDSLVDHASSIYLMKNFPAEYKNDDISRLFETYVCAKRKIDDSATTTEATPASPSAMVDVGEESAPAAGAPSSVPVTAAPKIQWIDDTSVFLSVPVADTAKMTAFLEGHLKAEQAKEDGAVPNTITITLFASPPGYTAPAAAATQ